MASDSSWASSIRRWRHLPLVALLCLWSSAVFALDGNKAFHNYVRDNWSIEQGLPQISVSAIAQDPAGYIWVGTLGGLARFDGVHFTTYTPSNDTELPGGLIQALRSDNQGRLWVATQKGLAYYQNNHFTKLVPQRAGNAALELDVQAVLPSSNGEVYAATTTGLYRVVGNQLVADTATTSPLYTLIESGNERWLGGWGGVYHVQDGDSQLETLPGLGLHDTVLHLATTGDGIARRIWAGTSAGLFYRTSSGWHRYTADSPLANSAIGMLFEDRDRNLWVGDQNGLSRVRDGVVTEQIDNDRMGARWDYLTAFEDREGNLWLGSRTRGLSRLWSGLTTRFSTQEGLITPLVWSLDHDSEGRVWVGTDNGLCMLENGRFHSIVQGTALPDPNVYSLLVEPDQVWLGTLHGAAVLRHGKLEIPPAFSALEGLRINGIYRDHLKRLWLATSNGLYRYADNSLTRCGEASGLTDPSVRLIYETPGGRLLLGTQYGLAEFSDERIRMLGDGNLPADIDVTAIHELPDGRLVVGTTTEQLFVNDAGHWVEFNHNNGLPQNSAFFITHDDNGYLWVSGIRGVYRALLDDLRWRPNGLQPSVRAETLGNELGARSTGQKGECCNGAGNSKGYIRKETLWLPTRDGILAIPTGLIAYNPVPPSVVIESVANNSRTWNAATLNHQQLPAASRDLSFKFTALSFQDPYAVELQYRLEGYDHEWRPLKNTLTRYVDYTNLPPGDYVFEVRGANNAGVWNPTPAMLHFHIAPHFHETAWFYVVIGLLFVTLIYGGHRWQLRALTRRRLELERLVSERTDALALANQQLETASYTDPLTGLLNRRYLLNQLPQDLGFYRRNSADCCDEGDILLFALVDIDHFKRINDSHGHGGGDMVLQQFSTLLTDLVRIGDYVTRWGGEEFLIVSRPLPRQHATAYISRICTVIAGHPFDVSTPLPLHLTCSVGFSEYPLHNTPPDLDWQKLIELADNALYYVKGSGRNGWATFHFKNKAPTAALMDKLRNDRAGLIARGELELITSSTPPEGEPNTRSARA